MKPPKPSPADQELIRSIFKSPDRIGSIVQQVQGPLVSGKYLHWDELRHRQPPGDLSLLEWWWGIRSHRRGRPVPLADRGAGPFSYNLADPIPEYLREIDLMTGGTIAMPEPITNPESRNSYLVRSLVEEAFTSSQLEGAASTREIAQALVRQSLKPRDRGERMILNNYRAMQQIIEIQKEPLSADLVFRIHRIVTEGTLDDPSGAGRLRRDDEYRIVGDDHGEIFHEPPVAGQLEARMAAMCEFANGKAESPYIHPAIRSMVLHFWLAYDHPFLDGNGRTARALFYWSMLHHGYWLFEFISISHVILGRPVAYAKAFLHSETDNNDLTYFLIYHAQVVRQSIEQLKEYIAKRSGELKALGAELRSMAALNHRQRELISHAIRHPEARYTVESHRASHDVSRQTANNDLLDLEAKGLLTKWRHGSKNQFLPAADIERKLRRSK